jgi:hypothetical protein
MSSIPFLNFTCLFQNTYYNGLAFRRSFVIEAAVKAFFILKDHPICYGYATSPLRGSKYTVPKTGGTRKRKNSPQNKKQVSRRSL